MKDYLKMVSRVKEVLKQIGWEVSGKKTVRVEINSPDYTIKEDASPDSSIFIYSFNLKDLLAKSNLNSTEETIMLMFSCKEKPSPDNPYITFNIREKKAQYNGSSLIKDCPITDQIENIIRNHGFSLQLE